MADGETPPLRVRYLLKIESLLFNIAEMVCCGDKSPNYKALSVQVRKSYGSKNLSPGYRHVFTYQVFCPENPLILKILIQTIIAY